MMSDSKEKSLNRKEDEKEKEKTGIELRSLLLKVIQLREEQ